MDYNFVIDGEEDNGTDTVPPNSFIQLNADGTLLAQASSDTSTGTWKINNTKLVMTGSHQFDFLDGYDIKKSASSELQLYYKETNTNGYTEVTFLLHK